MFNFKKAVWLAVALNTLPALAQVETIATTNTDDLRDALKPAGMTIDAVTIWSGVEGQFGTYRNFEVLPVTIRPGIVLSSGSVANLGPIPSATDPNYDAASPPSRVNSQMSFDPNSSGTFEFDNFGTVTGTIENFSASFDVAALRVDFTLSADSPVKFDFLFGSVEFPFYTSSFTDAFLVFLDGTDPNNQITFDATGSPVQVGVSFAGLETTADLNTAFSNPHGLIHHLTTTTAVLPEGEHFLIFEVGDVNDPILDSAVFISNLRAEAGNEGTEPSEDPPHAGCPVLTQHPADVTVAEHGTATFAIHSNGAEPLHYQWQRDHVAIDPIANPSAATPALILANVGPSDAGDYRCRVENDCGDETSDSARLTVTAATCIGDLNGDNSVNLPDLSILLSNFGCSDAPCAIDLNGDGVTNLTDLSILLSRFGTDCV